MDTNALKKFAQGARRELLAQVEARLEQVLTTDSVELREKLGVVNELRTQLEKKSREYLIEEVAYTWFNRFCALRYMDVNQITNVGIVSPIEGFTQPEILQDAKQGIFDKDWTLDRPRVQGLLNGDIPSSNPEGEAYRLLLVAVCNSYAEKMEFLFPRIEDYTELLMPEDLLSTQSVLHAVREALTKEVCQDVEVIGWLYQFYISEKKDQVMGGKGAVAKEDIPAVTQLFTPHWIVRYMVENSLGRLWLLNHPESKIRNQMEYYIPPHLNPLPKGEEDLITPDISQKEHGQEETISRSSLLPQAELRQATSAKCKGSRESYSGEGQNEGGPDEFLSGRSLLPEAELHHTTSAKCKGSREPYSGEGQDEGKLSNEIIQRCRELRKNATDAEQLIWSCLRDRNLGGYKFRRQHPIGRYILDFYCHEVQLCVEIDGGGHAEPEQHVHDAERTAYLEKQGITVIRFWNHEVLEDTESVLERILEICQARSPHLNPLPEGEEDHITTTIPQKKRGEEEITLSLGERAKGEGVLMEDDFLRVTSPEELKILDPACGSGHILTYAFDLLYAIYEENGYDPVNIPQLILEKNLYGIEIDKRAAMLSSFALMMKAVEKDKRFFTREVQPNILEMEDVVFDPKEIKDYMAKVGEDLWTQDLWLGLQQFENAKTFGSLIRPSLKDVPELRERLKSKGVFEDLFLGHTNEKVQKALQMSEYLNPRYQVVIANPPYFSKGMDSDYKQFAKDHYPDSKRDTLTMFMERNLKISLKSGYVSMVTLMSWMFLSSFETLRENLIKNKTILTMAHLDAHAFNTIGGEVVATTMFVIKNKHHADCKGTYFRLVDGSSELEKSMALKDAIANPNCGWFFKASATDFEKIPGKPIAYWISEKIRNIFSFDRLSDQISVITKGIYTGRNAEFIRYWFEVNNKEEGWHKYDKAGGTRKWYGLSIYVLNWKYDGKKLREFQGSGLGAMKYYNKPHICWSKITSKPSFRFAPDNVWFDDASPALVDKYIDYRLLNYLNSCLIDYLLNVISPTFTYQIGDIKKLPLLDLTIVDETITQKLINLSKEDWDSHELSWDFAKPSLFQNENIPVKEFLETRYSNERNKWFLITKDMQKLENENNKMFIEAYGLTDDLSPFVPLEEITLLCNPYYYYGGNYSEDELEALLLEDTMKEFISYAVGCVFGRYSLDKPGLILANQGETVEDYYNALSLPSPMGKGVGGEGEITFAPTETNVIPILEGEWFSDDILTQFKHFLRITFGEQNFAENLRFIGKALGKDLQKYFTRDFYKDHVKMYKKCPIYWLFSSPNGSFNALIYMHRYTPETVSVVLNQYLREFRDKLSAHRKNLERISSSTNASAREKSQALKEREKTAKILAELKQYEDEVLFPLASQQISIDLDDGVKVNYARFGNALKKI